MYSVSHDEYELERRAEILEQIDKLRLTFSYATALQAKTDVNETPNSVLQSEHLAPILEGSYLIARLKGEFFQNREDAALALCVALRHVIERSSAEFKIELTLSIIAIEDLILKGNCHSASPSEWIEDLLDNAKAEADSNIERYENRDEYGDFVDMPASAEQLASEFGRRLGRIDNAFRANEFEKAEKRLNNLETWIEKFGLENVADTSAIILKLSNYLDETALKKNVS